MENFMENITFYGSMLGLVIMTICFVIYYIKTRSGKIKESTTLLPFTGIAAIFSTVGISVMIQSAYYYPIGKSIEFFLGLALNIPLIIIFIVNVQMHIRDTKQEIIYEQEQKYSKW